MLSKARDSRFVSGSIVLLLTGLLNLMMAPLRRDAKVWCRPPLLDIVLGVGGREQRSTRANNAHHD